MECYRGAKSRREFLQLTVGGAATAALAASPAQAAHQAVARAQAGPPAAPLPTIRLGAHTVTRLVSGGNPVGGYSHATPDLSAAMLEWFTPERTVAYVHQIEREGINTWQFDYFDYIAAALRTARDQGSKIQFICVHHAGRNGTLPDVIRDVKPIAVMHHGGVTDSLFRQGKASQVRDFMKRAKDLGVLAGVSTHNPDNLRRMVSEGWEADLYMTCFHNLTRPVDEQRKKFGGTAAFDEPFVDTDPGEMAAAIRDTKTPCLAFKILAAGRRCWSAEKIDAAFSFAFSNIKPIDAVIVGMFPRYKDQITENARLARKHGALPPRT
jgi:hypothetical protein